jgi:hypothetical protein
MEVFFMFISAIASTALFIGLVMLIFKKHRARGKRISLWAFAAVMVLSVVTGVMEEPTTDKRTAVKPSTPAQKITAPRTSPNGWVIITRDEAEDTSRSDAREAIKALHGFYLNQMERSAFAQRTASTARCDWKSDKGMRFAGCRLISLEGNSDWDVFLIARLSDGRLAASPVNGMTRQHVISSWPSAQPDPSARSRKYLLGFDGVRAYLAEFEEPIDIGRALDLFK